MPRGASRSSSKLVRERQRLLERVRASGTQVLIFGLVEVTLRPSAQAEAGDQITLDRWYEPRRHRPTQGDDQDPGAPGRDDADQANRTRPAHPTAPQQHPSPSATIRIPYAGANVR
jgi:hypothetical protein